MKKILILIAIACMPQMHAAAQAKKEESKSLQTMFGEVETLLDRNADLGNWTDWKNKNNVDYERIAELNRGIVTVAGENAYSFIGHYSHDYITMQKSEDRRQLTELVTKIAPKILGGEKMDLVQLGLLDPDIEKIEKLGATGTADFIKYLIRNRKHGKTFVRKAKTQKHEEPTKETP